MCLRHLCPAAPNAKVSIFDIGTTDGDGLVIPGQDGTDGSVTSIFQVQRAQVHGDVLHYGRSMTDLPGVLVSEYLCIGHVCVVCVFHVALMLCLGALFGLHRLFPGTMCIRSNQLLPASKYPPLYIGVCISGTAQAQVALFLLR